jgi:Flp pilus assembly protein TadD
MTKDSEQLYKRASSEMKRERWLAAIGIFKERPDVVDRNWRLSWNFGWCYFKLERYDVARKHLIRANRLKPENPGCKLGLGMVYVMKRNFRKAEALLAESLRIKESHITRAALALAYLSQGKIAEAESVHLGGIKIRPKSSQSYEAYAVFLSDVGREKESRGMNEKANALKRIN